MCLNVLILPFSNASDYGTIFFLIIFLLREKKEKRNGTPEKIHLWIQCEMLNKKPVKLSRSILK